MICIWISYPDNHNDRFLFFLLIMQSGRVDDKLATIGYMEDDVTVQLYGFLLCGLRSSSSNDFTACGDDVSIYPQ